MPNHRVHNQVHNRMHRAGLCSGTYTLAVNKIKYLQLENIACPLYFEPPAKAVAQLQVMMIMLMMFFFPVWRGYGHFLFGVIYGWDITY